jgi:hypothetical protein
METKNEEIELNSIKNEYEIKINNLKAVLQKAKMAYEQQKQLCNEKVIFPLKTD